MLDDSLQIEFFNTLVTWGCLAFAILMVYWSGYAQAKITLKKNREAIIMIDQACYECQIGEME